MVMKTLTLILSLGLFVTTAFGAPSDGLQAMEQLGKALFFDTNLSDPTGQSCAACHAPQVGFTGLNQVINAHGAVYEGAVAGRFGNRKPPAAAYAGDSPTFHYDTEESVWIGGMFWDGRATGWTLGDPLAEQALGPFLNPLEQNMASASAVVAAVAASSYAELFKQVWGQNSLDPENVNAAYGQIGRSIASYERSKEVSPFTSKYDAYLAGKAKLVGEERRGLKLFLGKAKCALCHTAESSDGKPPLFTDFTYDNLGVPKNLENPFYDSIYNAMGDDWVDPGLGGFLKSAG
jgi:cytochrome c peroxidase